jgi:hypothetical protein
MRIIDLLLAAGALVAAPAMAERNPDKFLTCDGYAAPTRKGDGITKGSWLFGLASTSSDFRRSEVGLGTAGAEACERALADPLLQPQFSLRRAHLQQGKAIHLLAAGESQKALAALQESDATGAGGEARLFAESVGIGNRALRAWALIQMWKRDEARVELDAIDRQRPQAATLHGLARDIRMEIDPGLDAYLGALRKAAPLEPRFLPVLFNIAIVYGRFEEAVALYPQIEFDLPRNHGGWRLLGTESLKYDLIAERARFAGAMHYALRALGRADRAAALLAEARADVQDATQPPERDQDGRISKSRQKDYDSRLAAAGKANATLDGWEKAAELRREAVETSLEAVAPRLAVVLGRDYPVMLDVIRSGKTANAQEKEAVDKVAATVEAEIDKGRRELGNFSLAKLVEQLPRPETADNTPRFKSGGDGYFLSDNGFHVSKGEDGLRIRFVSATASPAMVEELAMLAAAQQARAAGKDGFIIQSRNFAQRTLRQYGYMSSYHTDIPSGYEVELRILPVSARALPPALEGSRWRLIEAQPILDALQAKYAAPAAPARS